MPQIIAPATDSVLLEWYYYDDRDEACALVRQVLSLSEALDIESFCTHHEPLLDFDAFANSRARPGKLTLLDMECHVYDIAAHDSVAIDCTGGHVLDWVRRCMRDVATTRLRSSVSSKT